MSTQIRVGRGAPALSPCGPRQSAGESKNRVRQTVDERRDHDDQPGVVPVEHQAGPIDAMQHPELDRLDRHLQETGEHAQRRGSRRTSSRAAGHVRDASGEASDGSCSARFALWRTHSSMPGPCAGERKDDRGPGVTSFDGNDDVGESVVVTDSGDRRRADLLPRFHQQISFSAIVSGMCRNEVRSSYGRSTCAPADPVARRIARFVICECSWRPATTLAAASRLGNL